MKQSSDPIYLLDGVRYLSSGQVATLLKVDQRTVLRWVKRVSMPTAPKLLKTLVWIRDPISGFTYFSEKSILAFKHQLAISRPMRVRR